MATARQTRPHRPAVPPLPTMDMLDDTHRQILLVLDDLQHLLRTLGHAGAEADAAMLAARACKFFAGPVRGHHDAEETQVFPLLLAHAPPEMLNHVRRLQQDHNWLEEDWLEIEPHLQAVAHGHGRAHVDFLRAALPDFTRLYREHIALEETMIYPEARRRQTPADTAG